MLQKKYVSQPSAIASYNYTDLAENTGVTLFYAAATSNDYILTQNQIYSSAIEESAASASGSWVLDVDRDYDLTAFQAPHTLRGTALFNYTLAVGSATDAYMHVYIRKWDGTTETEIANASGSALVRDGATTQQRTEALAIVIPETVFKPKEQLRITANLYTQASTVDVAYYGSDPMNRDGTGITPTTAETTTQFKCWIPFNLDL